MDVYQRRRLVALGGVAGVVVLVAAVIAGGGDDEEPAVPVTTIGATGSGVAALPTDEFIAEADAICGEADAALEGIDATSAEGAAQEQAEIVAAELDQLRSLPAPEEDAETLDAFLAALQEQAAALGDQQLAAERGDDAALAELDASVASAESDASTAASDFGFEVCGDPSASAGVDAGAATDTGVASAPTEPVPTAPAPTEPVPTEPVAPTADPTTPGGGATPDPAAPAPDDGGDSGDSGGVSP